MVLSVIVTGLFLSVCVFLSHRWMNLSWNVPSESSSGHSLRREGCDVLGDATIHYREYAVAVLLMGS